MYSPKNWSIFKLKDLFDIETGVDLIYGDLEDGEYPVIGHCEFNHGITRYTKKLDDYKLYDHTKTISLGDRGTFIAYTQPQDFYIGTRVKSLTAKFPEANIYVLMFIATCINLEQYKFCYGRNATNKTPNIEIKLPVNTKGEPNWQFMEDFIKEKYKKAKKRTATKIKTRPDSLDISDWKEFKISDLFNVKGTKTTKLDDLELAGPGMYPYVTTQAVDNGVAGYYSIFTEEGNVITADSAVIGFCSYQEKPFSASDHVEKLIPKFKMNKFNALFIVTMLNKENYRYSYGRKFNQTKIKDTIIKLPVDSQGNPDWQFMENYIKSLPYSDLI